MLGLTPAVWITEATAPSADAVSSKPSTALRSVTSQLHGFDSDAKTGKRFRRFVEAVLPDVAEDKGVVAPEDLRRRESHSACTTGYHRYTAHGQ